MDVSISKFNRKKREAITDAVQAEWQMEESYYANDTLSFSGKDYLYAGTSDAEFAVDLAKVIFEANGRPCKIEVLSTYLENPPCESYSFGKYEYNKLIGKSKKRDK
jgi:hypothetical protein